MPAIPRPSGGATEAPGFVKPYGGATAPSGYLLCDGSAVSRTTYAALFSAIASAFGNGDGSTTFNVPDLRGRVIAGKDNMGGSAANRLTNASGSVDGSAIGAAGGEEQHTLVNPELANHTHPMPALTYVSQAQSDVAVVGQYIQDNSNPTGGVIEASAGAHNNVQPTAILNYVIKT